MKTLFPRLQHFFNSFIIVIALACSACGRTAPVPPPLPPSDTKAQFTFCTRIHNTQVSMFSKMEPCDRAGVLHSRFYGMDIPGFPPNAGYCGETFGAQCYQEQEALATLEDCVAMMPVCLPERVSQWEELWRHTCLNQFNKASKSTSCDIQEHSGPGQQLVVDEED